MVALEIDAIAHRRSGRDRVHVSARVRITLDDSHLRRWNLFGRLRLLVVDEVRLSGGRAFRRLHALVILARGTDRFRGHDLVVDGGRIWAFHEEPRDDTPSERTDL